MKKKCAVFQGAGKKFAVREFDVASPQTGYAGLDLISSGICGTDVHICEGRLAMPDMPLIIGHEFIGRIREIGAGNAVDAMGNKLAVGDIAISCVAIPCGKCLNCLAGETASCLAFGVTYVKNVEEEPHFHGGFAEYLYSPFANLIKLPENVDPFAAAAFPCGGPTVIRSCVYGGGLKAGELVVIQGNGSLGIFAAAYAKQHGCKVVVIGSGANAKRVDLTMAVGPDKFFDFRKDSPETIA
jgi:D-arabinose 1-dehydrogenase-like Zn-dependent alcohol dehydrogenase